MHKQLSTEQINETRTNLELGVQGPGVFNILPKSADKNVADAAQDERRGVVKHAPYIKK